MSTPDGARIDKHVIACIKHAKLVSKHDELDLSSFSQRIAIWLSTCFPNYNWTVCFFKLDNGITWDIRHQAIS